MNQGLIDPLTDLIAENAPYIQQMTEEGWTFASNNTVDGEIWSILQIPNVTGMGGGFVVKKEYVDETDWQYEPQKIYTLDELGELFSSGDVSLRTGWLQRKFQLCWYGRRYGKYELYRRTDEYGQHNSCKCYGVGRI